MQPFHDLLHRLDRGVTRHNMEANENRRIRLFKKNWLLCVVLAVAQTKPPTLETIAHQLLLTRGFIMLYTIAVVLVILWLLGLVTSVTMGGFIHVLLVVAIISVLLRLIR